MEAARDQSNYLRSITSIDRIFVDVSILNRILSLPLEGKGDREAVDEV